MFIIKKSFNILGLIFFTISINSIFLQFFSSFFSSLISPAIFIAIICFTFSSKIKRIDFINFLIIFILLALNLGVSLLYFQNSLEIGMRFFLILVLLPLATMANGISKYLIRIFQVSVLIFMLFLLFLEIYYILHPGLWIVDRVRWLEQGIGDVYTFNNFYYRIQIKGTALIPISFFIFYLNNSGRKKIIISAFYLLIIMIAGNTMYLVSIISFVGLKELSAKKVLKKKYSVFTSFLIIFSPGIGLSIISYFLDRFSKKGESSFPIRVDQMKVLIGNLSTSLYNFLFGKGLGNVLPSGTVTVYRDYSNNTYFELQTIYILNQLGALNFLVYLFLLGKLILNNWRSKYVRISCLSYMIYAITNPYIFDTTNLIAFLIFTCFSVNCIEGEKKFE